MAVWRSKLGNTYPKAEIDRCDRERHAILKDLRKQCGNDTCADCGAKDTLWVSVNIGVFLCVRCADVHRGLGTHISKVKGLSGTYLWGPDEISRLQNTGNVVINMTHLASCTTPLPDDTTGKEDLLAFGRKKYEQKLWYSELRSPATVAPPSATLTLDCFHKEVGFTRRSQQCNRPLKTATAVAVTSKTIYFNFDEFFDLLGIENETDRDFSQPCADHVAHEKNKLDENRLVTLDTFLDDCLMKQPDMSAVAPKRDQGLLWDSDDWFSMQGV